MAEPLAFHLPQDASLHSLNSFNSFDFGFFADASLSDAACGLIGSIGLGDSASYTFDDRGQPTLAMFDPSGGTAPDIAGKNLVNPSAALLARVPRPRRFVAKGSGATR